MSRAARFSPSDPAAAALSGAALAAGIFLAYCRTFSAPLLLDDVESIGSNPTIRRLWPVTAAFSPPEHAGVGGRPLLNFSFALNYHFGGVAPAGYHLVNIAIHCCAAWTLFALVRRTLRLPVLAGRFGANATSLAFAIAALWAWHPVQTESVTYLSQRAESLMSLFYLQTLYWFARACEGRLWEAAICVLCCVLGMMTKEVMVTAPLAALMYDRAFLSGSWSAALRRHGRLLAALAGAWIPLLWLMRGLPHRNVGFGLGVGVREYGLAECSAIVRYLRLALWPRGLVFDYGIDWTPSPADMWASAAVLAALVAAAIALWRRFAPAGFAALGFFVLLVPTSSVIPVVGQPVAESRVYLALAGIVALAVLAAYAWLGGKSFVAMAAAAVALGTGTYVRNGDYGSAERLWRDTVQKNPGSARAHDNLGCALADSGRFAEAAEEHRIALRIRPDIAATYNNLGNSEMGLGDRGDAIAQFETAIRMRPDFADAIYNLGTALSGLPGREEEAIAEFKRVLALEPDFVPAQHNLAVVWENLGDARSAEGRFAEAAQEFAAAVRIDPESEEAHYDLANVLKRLPGRLNDSIAEYGIALRLRPDHAEAHNNFGTALLAAGRRDEAVAQFEAALRLKPDFAAAHLNLEAAQNP